MSIRLPYLPCIFPARINSFRQSLIPFRDLKESAQISIAGHSSETVTAPFALYNCQFLLAVHLIAFFARLFASFDYQFPFFFY